MSTFVRAARIAAIEPSESGPVLLFESQAGPRSVTPDSAYCCRHEPHVGGYFITHADGGESFLSAETFEANYRLPLLRGRTTQTDPSLIEAGAPLPRFPGVVGDLYCFKE